ncbi:PREDICTED: uncharacterized protein LOC104827262 isoform X2 [Tarenaya hassleriana]|nr:PREDICTED: uncharacterized protein LOC104827262 isoform X2 [Tarenaya hassleriana]
MRLSLEVPLDLCGLFLRISGPAAMFPGLSMALPWLQWLLSEPDKEGLWFETLVSLGPNTQHGRCGGKAGYLWLACILLSLSYRRTMEFSGTEASDRTHISVVVPPEYLWRLKERWRQPMASFGRGKTGSRNLPVCVQVQDSDNLKPGCRGLEALYKMPDWTVKTWICRSILP